MKCLNIFVWAAIIFHKQLRKHKMKNSMQKLKNNNNKQKDNVQIVVQKNLRT